MIENMQSGLSGNDENFKKATENMGKGGKSLKKVSVRLGLVHFSVMDRKKGEGPKKIATEGWNLVEKKEKNLTAKLLKVNFPEEVIYVAKKVFSRVLTTFWNEICSSFRGTRMTFQLLCRFLKSIL